MSFLDFVSYARKFFVAMAAALAVAASALSDGVISQSEWIGVVLAFLGALGVYFTPNETPELSSQERISK